MTLPNIKIAVIGGSGLYRIRGLKHIEEIEVSTPFGDPSDALITGRLAGVPVAFLPRHGRGHVHTPSEAPYRANIYALKKLGVEKVISVSACGSLREDMAPGHIVVPDQLVDFTKLRTSSFFGAGWVGHISAADPFCPALSALLADELQAADATVHCGATFITIEGPRFSTKGESRLFRSWGMDIIGMTTSPEAFLAREAGMCYAVLAHITDYDVWHESEETVTVQMIVRRLQANVKLARKTLRRLIPRLAESMPACECANALDTALITDKGKIPPETKEKLRLIVKG